MSQFDFPRIIFFGKAVINPPTANNNNFYPLFLFDPINVKAIMPPRIYLSEKQMRTHLLGLLALPEKTPILRDGDKACYIEIKNITNNQAFKKWATTPLGESPLDSCFHPFYKIMRASKSNQNLTGSLPCNWNYFGGMDFGFDNVTVTSIQVPAKDNECILYTNKSGEYPSDIEKIMHASVNFKNESGKSTAVMVDVTPSMPYYTQIFCDSFTINKNGSNFLRGNPSKASVRFLNEARIVNQEGAVAGSGTFYCVIPVSELAEGTESPVIRFFEKYRIHANPIAGVFIRYDLFEVNKNQHPDYPALGCSANPARCSVLGSIAPWYESDLKTITMGRQMLPDQPYLSDKTLPPFVFRINQDRKLISLDLIGSIPETCTTDDYQTYDLGEIKVKCKLDNQEEVEIGSVSINEQTLSRDSIIASGGIIDIPYQENIILQKEYIERGLFQIYGMSKKDIHDEGTEALLMKESEFMIASDQAGLYMNQNDDPKKGYICHSHKKEPCRVTIYHKGSPLKGVLPMKIQELRVNSFNAIPEMTTFMEIKDFSNNQELHFPSHKPANVIYVLFPGNPETSGNLNTYILNTGFIISLRILPKHNYGRYLDPDHSQYPTPVTFDLVYKEILEVYDLVYPASSIITPFLESYFKQGWKFIKQRLSPNNWSSYSYMPSSRDMSDDQWKLLCKWGEQIELSGKS